MDLLKKQNHIYAVSKDTLIEVESYKIADYKTSSAYEGHYIHRDTKLVSKMEKLAFKGDMLSKRDKKS
jgi:hypothetical protein